jgi:hypothetical protein
MRLHVSRAVWLLSALVAIPACKSGGDAAPAPAASTAPAASGAPAAAAVVAPVPAKDQLAIVAESPDPILLYPLQGGAFVDAAGFLALLGEGPIRQVPAVMKGLEKGVSGKIVGSWPDGAWLVADELLKWTRDRWAPNQLLRENEKLLDVTAWSDNRAVAAIAMPNNDMRFFLVGGKSGVVVPSPYPADKPKAEVKAVEAIADAGEAGAPEPAPPLGESDDKPADDASCKVKMKPEQLSLGGLPTGHLYAAGYECQESGKGEAIVERWEPKKVRGSVELLPKAEGGGAVDIQGVLARSPSEVYVFGAAGSPEKPYLARFDGKSWALEAAPFASGIASLTAGSDGALWAVERQPGAAAPGGLWKKPSGGAWGGVALPSVERASVVAKGVWVRATDDVWAVATTPAGHGVLLRSKAEKEPIQLASRKVMADLVASNRRWAATPVCDKVYAHLTTLGSSKDPVPKGFGTLKEVFAEEPLKGLQPIVEDDGAHLYIGVPVPSLDVGQKLLAKYKEKNPKALPNLFCHEPVITKLAIHFE